MAKDTQEVIARRLKSAISEVALRHRRRVTPEMRAEVIEACSKILSEYPIDTGFPEIALDPIQDITSGSYKFWVGGLPPLKLLPGESSEDE